MNPRRPTPEDLKSSPYPKCFVDGGTPKTWGARDYMKMNQKATQFYPRYAESSGAPRCKVEISVPSEGLLVRDFQ